jgi:hypothetical protein
MDTTMKTARILNLIVAVLVCALALGTTATQAQDLATHFGPVTLDAKGYPDQKGIDTIYDEIDYQRACQAYVWALPAVGMEGQFLMQKHFGATGPYDTLLLYGADTVGGMLTPNTTVGYVVTMANLLETGPLVLENPEGETVGLLMDYWQRWIADFGLTGPAQGKAEKLLILGPGQEVPAGAEGYRVVRSLTAVFCTPHASSIPKKTFKPCRPRFGCIPSPIAPIRSRSWSLRAAKPS